MPFKIKCFFHCFSLFSNETRLSVRTITINVLCSQIKIQKLIKENCHSFLHSLILTCIYIYTICISIINFTQFSLYRCTTSWTDMFHVEYRQNLSRHLISISDLISCLISFVVMMNKKKYLIKYPSLRK